MPPPNHRDEVLLQMLADIEHEAAAIRSHDPTRAAALDDAAADIRTILDEGRRATKATESCAMEASDTGGSPAGSAPPWTGAC